VFFWNVSVWACADLLKDVNRELYFYGITIGQVGFGFLVSRKSQPTKRAGDNGNESEG
jgi:hypothetical protein